MRSLAKIGAIMVCVLVSVGACADNGDGDMAEPEVSVSRSAEGTASDAVSTEFCSRALDAFSQFEAMSAEEKESPAGAKKAAALFAAVADVAPARYKGAWNDYVAILQLTARMSEDPTSSRRGEIEKIQKLEEATAAVGESIGECD